MQRDLDILLGDEFCRSVEENLDRDPMRIALDGKAPHAALVASQVKYLRRAESKLPSWFAARCILPPTAFEQASSERTASRKVGGPTTQRAGTVSNDRAVAGSLAIDLTCGLGVDSFYLSQKFERVIAVEHDPQLAAIVNENFRRLGARNIEVVCASAEEFMKGFEGRADLVYADPDRRNAAGKKMVRMEECSPDIVALLPCIEKIAPRLVVKLSPLFDVDEVFRLFGSHTCVEVVSLDGECKEIVAEIADDILFPTLRAVAIGTGEAEYPFDDGWHAPEREPEREFSPETYNYLIIPDVAMQKARLARRYFSEQGGRSGNEIWIDSDNGYGFCCSKPGDVMGRVLEIERIEPFDPKALRRRLKAGDIKSIDIMRRNFPLSTTDIARSLGVREGGRTTVVFTRATGRLWQITIR